jgi:SSS family solute:Na+ symporter
VSAPGCLNRDHRQAVGAFLRGRCFWLRLRFLLSRLSCSLQLVDPLDHDEYRESNYYEVNDGADEHTIVDSRCSGYFSFWGLGTSSIMWLLLPTVMYTLIGQDFYQRLFAAKDKNVARTASILGGIILVVVAFFPTIIGMGARALSDLEAGGTAFPWVVQNLMNPVVGGVVLAAILAAIMSTADSLLTAATSHIVKDFWIETFQVDEIKDEKRLLAISRNFTVILGILGLLIALVMPGIIDALIYSYTMYSAGVFVPVIGGVVWKSATREGALASLVIGSAIALWGILTKANILGAPVEIYAALISLIIFIVVSLATQSQKTHKASAAK